MTQYYTATELVTHICEQPHGVSLCGIPMLELGGEPVVSELRSINPAPRQCQICASEQARILLEKTRGGKAQATPPSADYAEYEGGIIVQKKGKCWLCDKAGDESAIIELEDHRFGGKVKVTFCGKCVEAMRNAVVSFRHNEGTHG